MNGAVDQPETKHENGQHRVVHGVRIFQIDKTKQAPSWNALEAVFRAGPLGLYAKEIHQLRQGKRDHGEVNALSANGKPAEAQPEQGGNRGACQNAQFRRKGHHLDRMPSDVSRHAQKRRVAERQKAGIAKQQIEGAGEQREAEALHQEYRVDPGVRRNQGGEEQHKIQNGRFFHACVYPSAFTSRGQTTRQAGSATRSP